MWQVYVGNTDKSDLSNNKHVRFALLLCFYIVLEDILKCMRMKICMLRNDDDLFDEILNKISNNSSDVDNNILR